MIDVSRNEVIEVAKRFLEKEQDGIGLCEGWSNAIVTAYLEEVISRGVAEVAAKFLSNEIDHSWEPKLVAANTTIYNLQSKIDDLGSEFAIVNHFKGQLAVAKEALEVIRDERVLDVRVVAGRALEKMNSV